MNTRFNDGGDLVSEDKFRDECGVFGIFGHPEAANLAYLGLHALQHRGQESAGIVSSNGKGFHVERNMGEVGEVFDEETLSRLTGDRAIGHVRYSTAGESRLSNAQPLKISSHRGDIAVCHNGNLVNAGEVRDRLEREGSIFATTSDTEVVLHLIARSRRPALEDAVVDALTEVKGIGRWTAQIFMIFCLGRLDVLPVDDLGILDGAHQLYDLPERPDAAAMTELAARWSPYRSVGSWYVWQGRRLAMGEEGS